MIRVKVSAVFQVRDGFTGRALEGNRLVCLLDGGAVKPTVKPGGFLVLTNLPAGEHELTLRCVGFREERISFRVEDSGLFEGYAALKPGNGYSFHSSVTWLELQVPAGQETVWITTPCAAECKIAQTKAEAGEREFRVYCKGNPALLSIPGYFLVEDGENSEIVVLGSISNELGSLLSPLQKEHSRGRRLLPVQQYRSDGERKLRAVFSSSGSVVIWSGEGQPVTAELREGSNNVSIP